MGKYDDIISHPHHQSKTRQHMSQRDRAAQFAPFAALTGYDDSVREAARLTDEKIELGEAQAEAVNVRLNFLAEHLAEAPTVTVTYFKADSKKAGGAYLQTGGKVKKIDQIERRLVFTDKRGIPFDDILEIESELFPEDWD